MMGCDIHASLEFNDHGNSSQSPIYWYGWASNLFISRNYTLFALMAGVRNYDNVVPVSEPKGFPEDMSWSSKDAYYIHVYDGEGDGGYRQHCTSTEAETYVAHGSSEWVGSDRDKVTHPDYHSSSWLSTRELLDVQEAYEQIGEYHNCKDLEAILAVMLIFDPMLEGKARLVFTFDN